ncbi:hypothetical protein C9374_005414 [Naegleria lovaniensis]|uniref:Uncharacterized protein n=1 Tax=Naegleria lovaniensis TaxID=51637 RepID=A0AA88GPP4_NAELO|nr:uncharacterized protein C9374_005414 [Naegleria lovaniensis]KAG2382212.1 hypothetical protein C9374_005414 [Naegleria lovaniensis]
MKSTLSRSIQQSSVNNPSYIQPSVATTLTFQGTSTQYYYLYVSTLKQGSVTLKITAKVRSSSSPSDAFKMTFTMNATLSTPISDFPKTLSVDTSEMTYTWNFQLKSSDPAPIVFVSMKPPFLTQAGYGSLQFSYSFENSDSDLTTILYATLIPLGVIFVAMLLVPSGYWAIIKRKASSAALRAKQMTDQVVSGGVVSKIEQAKDVMGKIGGFIKEEMETAVRNRSVANRDEAAFHVVENHKVEFTNVPLNNFNSNTTQHSNPSREYKRNVFEAELCSDEVESIDSKQDHVQVVAPSSSNAFVTTNNSQHEHRDDIPDLEQQAVEYYQHTSLPSTFNHAQQQATVAVPRIPQLPTPIVSPPEVGVTLQSTTILYDSNTTTTTSYTTTVFVTNPNDRSEDQYIPSIPLPDSIRY